ncbi:MAG: ABC transporter ATP-binding protein/permease [Symbiobacteriaceae bacterium]|nr:ABC transporter ATP-binding protein/permease [Symbiobacteriaceae bacterium]
MFGAKKISHREAWQYTLRGFRTFRDIAPGSLGAAVALGILDGIIPLVAFALSAQIIDALATGQGAERCYLLAGVAVVLAFLLAGGRVWMQRWLAVTSANSHLKLYLFLARRYLKLDYLHVANATVNESVADIEAKTNGNGIGLLACGPNGTRLTVQYLSSVLGAAFLLGGIFNTRTPVEAGFITSPVALASIVLLMLLNLGWTWYLNGKVRELQQTSFSANPKWNTVYAYYHRYVQPGAAAKDLRIYNQEEAILGLIKIDNIWHTFFHRFGLATSSQELGNSLIAIAVYLLIGLRALAGMYSIGNVVQYVGAITALTGSGSALVSQVVHMRNNADYLPQVYDYLDLPDREPSGKPIPPSSYHQPWEIAFEDVSFIYPGSSNYALKNLSLKLHVGQRLAVVGENGSGKTTMIKLLCGFYEPTAGRITLNGVDIKEYAYADYIALLAVVLQDFTLLGLNLGQNVATAKEYDTAKAQEALNLAGFAERLATLEDGLETVLLKDLHKTGVNISGGEGQKIAMARALYRDAPFVIMDEPTAALDPIAEYDIYSRLDEIMGGKTAIYISHRLASCRFCDDIAVFHLGELVQRGSHEELLLDKEGKYHQLWTAQALHYVSPEVASPALP